MGCHALLQGVFLTQGLNPGPLIAGRVLTTEPPGKPDVSFVVFKGRGSNSNGCSGGRERGHQTWVQEGGLSPRCQMQTQVRHASSGRVCQPQTVA